MFAAALFRIAKNRKQLKYVLVGGQILGHSYNKILLSKEKKKIWYVAYDICHSMTESQRHYA